ncbi:uncharacterized protein LOC114931605 [Nylanderia fulva]|uniref:uncharacterized protein LOC114931605 n=1 Tax=Nylanderia fulva TaxID=613905 RepID=UPI0010FB44F3|nr:uncharacterized protein LOC114931605 [Nylanderia fulva]
MPGTTGPNVPLFLKFRNSWKNIDKTKYQTGLEDKIVQRYLSSVRIDEIRSFVEDSLQYLQPRDDYKEFLQLTLIFLGSVPSNNISFRHPGAFHHARWMAKGIYCLKIFIFRAEFEMTSVEIKAIRDISLFIVMLYVEAWFTCTVTTKAPNHDLRFLKNLYDYRLIDEEISTVTLQKFRNHLWYLNPECAAISFFDESMLLEVKRKMVLKLDPIEDIDNCYPKRIQMNHDIVSFCGKQMDYFTTPQSRNFFLKFEINDEFLKIDPVLWDQNANYQRSLNIVKHLKVVNDVAERGVHLFSEYNDLLTRNEDQKMFVLQIVSEYRKRFPDAKKETIMKHF